MGKIAFVFAGQGAQYVGMGLDLYANYPSVREIFDLLSDRLKNIVFHGPAEELNITLNTQPSLFVVDLVCARLLKEHGIHANAVAGFSLGEIPAVCYAGIMSEREAYEFVSLRATVMQKASEENPGAMLAVLKLPVEEVEKICRSLEDVYPVNYNCPGQTVVACSENSVASMQSAVLSNGGKSIRLSVSGAFHSPFMQYASDAISDYLRERVPGEMRIPVYSNFTAEVYGKESWEMLSEQVRKPVRWQKTIENMINDGFNTFIEVGAGKVLSGLIKKISTDINVLNVSDSISLENTIRELTNA